MTRRKTDLFRVTKLKRTYNRQTDTFTFNIQYETTAAKQTTRTRQVAEAFGLGTDNAQKFTILDNAAIKIRQGDITLITGDSGSGKSVLLKALKQDLGAEAADTKNLTINPTEPIIETLGKNTTEALELLSKVGLNDAFLFLRSYQQLSDGQKHRYQIARLAETGKRWWLLDEFCSVLDRDTAKIVSFNLQRLARERGATAVCATTHDDLTADLAPNVLIHKRFGKEINIRHVPNAEATECSLTKAMRITEATHADYKTLSQFHYRSGHCPAPRKIFALKRGTELCGVIVYGFPSPFCFGRSQVWKGTLKELMRDVSVVSRVVVHPKYRGIGLGVRLVRETLASAGTPCVEAIAVMARYNPFFEKAGMRRIAESKPNQRVTDALEQLERLGFDSALLASASYCRETIAKVGKEAAIDVLRELSRKGSVSRRSLVSLPNAFPTHEAFMTKLKALDTDGLALALKRLSFLSQTKVYLFWRRD
jgi:ABC-type lipoprotein export system ATPase subunit/GNAT superfamily N-acetyltransferase